MSDGHAAGNASERRERATRTERADEAARERACKGVRGAKPLGVTMTTMRPFRETIPVEDAKALALDAATPVDRIERISLSDASERVLATSVESSIDVPPFDRAAMDGYAVIA